MTFGRPAQKANYKDRGGDDGDDTYLLAAEEEHDTGDISVRARGISYSGNDGKRSSLQRDAKGPELERFSSTTTYSYDEYKEESEKMIAGSPTLPPYDKSWLTRNLCIFGLVISYLTALASLVGSIFIIRRRSSVDTTGNYVSPGIYILNFRGSRNLNLYVPLAFSIFSTICMESLSYIHSVSLRWAMYKDGLLQFNSNLRLLSSARTCFANGRFCNFVSTVCLVICYTASSQVISHDMLLRESVAINGLALLMFAAGMFTLCAISTVALFKGRRTILSWSSNPLNTALACVHHGLLKRRPGRAMMSVHDRNKPAQPTLPSAIQMPLRGAYRGVLYIIIFQHAIFIGTVVFMALVLHFLYASNGQDAVLSFHGDTKTTTQLFILSPSPLLSLFLTFLFGFAFQSLLALTFHSAELLVNVNRDEATWRAAYTSKSGASLNSGGLMYALSSWQFLLLFGLKPVAQWLFGSQGMSVDTVRHPSIIFNPVPLMFLCGAALILVLFQLYLILHRPKGPQPVTWGHLQTLVDLIDDWGHGDEGKIFWGSKGVNAEGIAHAGTSGSKAGVGAIHMGTYYS